MLRSMIWEGVSLQRVRPDGVSNAYAFIDSGTPAEVEVGPGQWVVSCTDDHYLQLNAETGQGLGSSPSLIPRKELTPFEVLPSQTRYLVIEPATSPGVLFTLNRLDGVEL